MTHSTHSPARRRAIAALGASWVGSSWAHEGLPSRALRLIVPAPAAGTSDFVARVLVEALRRTSGLSAVVENLPGVAGAVATEAFLAAPRDGATLLLAPNSLVTEVPYTVKPRYDPFKDIVPLAELAASGIVLVVNAGVPVRSVPEMIDYVRARPAQVAFASFGAGTISHVKGLQFCRAAGLDMLHVGYKGSPPALVDVLAGRVPFMFDGVATSLPHIKAQKLRALALTSPQRLDLLPELATFAELGYPDLTQTIGLTVFATPDVPSAVASTLRAHLLAALASPELRASFHGAGLQTARRDQSIDELRQTMRRDYERTGQVLRSIQYRPET